METYLKYTAVRSIFTSVTDARNKRDFPDEMMRIRVSHSSRGLCLNRYHHYRGPFYLRRVHCSRLNPMASLRRYFFKCLAVSTRIEQRNIA